MRRYRSGADLRRHLPGCAVCTSLCAVRSGQEAGGDRRSEDEPPNRSGYPSRRATTALSAGGTLSRPCCVPIIAFFPWFVNGFAEKFSDFFCFSLWRLYRMHNAWLGFCASQPSRTCDKAGSPWAVLGETARQIDSAVPFFCFHLFLFVLLRIFAQLAIVTILLLTPTRISECRRFYVLCGIRYPFTRMFDQRCLPRKLLFCFCRISGVPETVVPFPPGQRDR